MHLINDVIKDEALLVGQRQLTYLAELGQQTGDGQVAAPLPA
jgi:hypothetical protein